MSSDMNVRAPMAFILIVDWSYGGTGSSWVRLSICFRKWRLRLSNKLPATPRHILLPRGAVGAAGGDGDASTNTVVMEAGWR